MKNRYIVFDTETPNSANNRMSAIGISIVEDGKITHEKYYLVNPESEFDAFNVALTGITPSMVQNEPTFPEVWREIEPIMESGLLIAHNAPFDMSVISKCLCDYHINWHPYTYYACTCRMGRACFPDMPNHKLNTLCSHLNISLEHHNALSDSRACAELLLHCLQSGLKIDDYISTYDLANTCVSHGRRIKPSEESQKLLELQCILKDITFDGVLNKNEIQLLQEWLDNNIELRGNFPFDKIFETVMSALEDGILENTEMISMQQLFENITDPVANICICDDFDIAGKTFCLSGEFDFGEKSKVESFLAERGGIPVNGVTKKTNFVIVGGKGNAAWCAGNYGTKVKKALEMQSKGIAIQIIKEQDLTL